MGDAQRQRFLAQGVSWSSRLGAQDARLLEQHGVIPEDVVSLEQAQRRTYALDEARTQAA